MYDVAIVQLGRYGDMINVLPIAKAEADKRRRVVWLAHGDYIDLLDGVSYADPRIFDGEIIDILQAEEQARKLAHRVISPQTYGNRPCERDEKSFVLDMYRLAGYKGFYDVTAPVFDRRDSRRESQWLPASDEKPILLYYANGHSSPFPYRLDLYEQIVKWSERFEIIDLTAVRATRIYDLLGLMQRAGLMITTDSALLHLGTAVRVPTLAFTADKPTPWHGTAPKRHWLDHVCYSNYPQQKHLIDQILGWKTWSASVSREPAALSAVGS